MKTLGENIQRLRAAAGLTQEDLRFATGGRHGGIRPETLSRIETGKADNPELKTLVRIAAACGVEVVDLFFDAGGKLVDVPGFEEAREMTADARRRFDRPAQRAAVTGQAAAKSGASASAVTKYAAHKGKSARNPSPTTKRRKKKTG